ncbi:MAG: hypothetical protein ACREVJ_12165 [Gammaproteobacteria bacterium]
MVRRYRIRVSGKARENPDPAMLAQIVILIGRRLHAEAQHASRNEETETRTSDQAAADGSASQAGPDDE